MEPILSIHHLSKKYGSFHLNDISFTLCPGDILGLVGENGAGKSTLIKCILGITHPDLGTISLNGTSVSKQLDQIGYVPDQCPFTKSLRVEQVGRFCSGMFPGWDSRSFRCYLEKFALSPRQKICNLSRGNGMKLTIAVALSHHPELLLLDEATAGLDPVIRDDILNEFTLFAAEKGHGVILSSHIGSDLEKLCSHILYLHQGQVAAYGSKETLLTQWSTLENMMLLTAREGET